MRNNYWSCSRFADWLRGTEKLSAATSGGWRDWRRQAQRAHPVRYWIAETALDKIQDIVNWPVDTLYNIKYYINNRWVSRTHSLTAHPRDIRPGSWSDVGNRFLPCLFNELVDFVEIETAWHHIAWDTEARKKYCSPWWSYGWFRWRVWRCPKAGIEHLEWAAELDNKGYSNPSDPGYGRPTPQALAAREILDLYHWWKEERPARPDPHDASGWTELMDRRRRRSQEDDEYSIWEDSSPEEQRESRRCLKILNQIEKKYDQEDERMMIRLIKVRNHLWT